VAAFGRFDQFPELRILLKGLVFLHFQTGTEKEVLEGMSVQNAMDYQAQLMAFEIDAVVTNSEAMERAAGALELAELV
jgi:hypothetical protein